MNGKSEPPIDNLVQLLLSMEKICQINIKLGRKSEPAFPGMNRDSNPEYFQDQSLKG